MTCPLVPALEALTPTVLLLARASLLRPTTQHVGTLLLSWGKKQLSRWLSLPRAQDRDAPVTDNL